MSELKSEHTKALSKLLPPVSYRLQGEWAGFTPYKGIMVSDWERVLGLSNNRKRPLDERVREVLTRLNDKDLHSTAYLMDKAKQLGYEIKIVEPEPFRAGISQASEMLWGKGVKWFFLKSKHAEALSKLLPPVSYRPQGEWLYRSLLVEGLELDRIHAIAKQMLSGFNPYSGVMIGDWERVLGLSKNKKRALDERIEAVITKLNDKGSLSIPYIVDKAKQLGYEIKIVEPEPFRAGISRAGEILWDEGVKWLFFVDIGVPEKLYSGEYRLDLYGVETISDPVLEALLNAVQPAYTKYWIRYYNGQDNA